MDDVQPITPELNRQAVHDVRNLFGVVASAGHLLERETDRVRIAQLARAINDAALRGGQLATTLLAPVPQRSFKPVDANAQLLKLRPLLDAISNRGIRIDLDLCAGVLPMRAAPDHFDAVIVELVTNAAAATGKRGRITVRSRRVGHRAWIFVADRGRGMTGDFLKRVIAGQKAHDTHGIGLARVNRFSREAHGHFLLRSRRDRGTVACLNLPMLVRTTAEPIVPTPAIPYEMEVDNDHRQPLAA